MTPVPKKRRWLVITVGLTLALVVFVLVARLALTGMAVRTLLQRAGASEVKFNVAQASPWHVVMEDIGFQIRTQAFAAKRVTFDRARWWTPSLGAVRVEQVRLPLDIDGSATNPWAWSTYKGGAATRQPVNVPLEELSLDGQLIIQAAALPEQTLTVKIEARLGPKNTWEGKVQAAGPGLGVKAEGSFDVAKQALAFRVPEFSLDLKTWQGFVQRLVLLPGGAWDLEGKFTGQAAGRLAGKNLVAGGTVRLRDGRAAYAQRSIAAEGIEADLEFTDFDKFITQPGTLRVRELRTGQLPLHDLEAEVAFESATKFVVSRVSLLALGGKVVAEPFKYFTNLRELEAVLLVEGVSVEEVMGLTQDLPAKAKGRVNGRFPVRIDDSGLRIGTGWLELKPGVYAEIQFNANGLLTRGMAANSPSYAVLQKVESGLLKLKIGEMRLDIRPSNAPPGRSAQLHLVGEPVAPDVKAPVTLDLNVNGPLEKLLNLGLDSRLRFGAKP
ncbi:MAG: hypothetical protein EXS42_03740 [Lacunisphaera sp.]|nr:hypothetical protein [Lacunisphaera sp.]